MVGTIRKDFGHGVGGTREADPFAISRPEAPLAAEEGHVAGQRLAIFLVQFGSTEIAKRLNAIIVQILPFLAQEHQQQVATAVDRAKQVTMTELNAIIGQQRPDLPRLIQQMHAQQLPPGASMGPHPGIPPGAAATAGGTAAHPLSMLTKPDLHRGQPDDLKHNGGILDVAVVLEGRKGKGRDAFRPGPVSGLISKATLSGPALDTNRVWKLYMWYCEQCRTLPEEIVLRVIA
ncbi:Transducin-like enhancer protein 3 [Eufriesea mexicana]|uniref:Transducin-like enhancer protein 3 n=1 Tax=Eufriesea mexicana TaxID=516756 RepID=A0A310SJG5_9HYME|nr:Transducin-like enhancer protein 3 [Eufriesea mexicana]